ncbi:MAG: hypothetical protein BWY63_03571 [Chloroflexi bacterium ADurb.Bin360]|nr:MAG: hypothetical protein BWY63_03571 [Chloroflexi bacterium ADurb.Bin360]
MGNGDKRASVASATEALRYLLGSVRREGPIIGLVHARENRMALEVRPLDSRNEGEVGDTRQGVSPRHLIVIGDCQEIQTMPPGMLV